MRMKKTDHTIFEFKSIIVFTCIFLSLLLFFTKFHPIPIMDEDDVIYSVLVRKPIPVPGGWNPARILPEVLMGFCGHLSAISASLGISTFIKCQVFILGLILSCFITMYVFSLYRLLHTRFAASKSRALYISLLFLLFHFLVFRIDNSKNLHMFSSYDACCVCYYTIPAILNSTLVMNLMLKPDDSQFLKEKNWENSAFITVLYFSLFSNLFGSIVLAAFAGWMCLENAFFAIKLKRTAKDYISSNRLWISIIVVWLIAVLLEASGGRASITSYNSSYLLRLLESVRLFFTIIAKTNLLLKLIVAFSLIGSIIVSIIMKHKSGIKPFLKSEVGILVWGFTTGIFILMLCAAVDPSYIERPEVVFPFIFSIFLFTSICLNEIMQYNKKLEVFFPIAILFVLSMINTRSLTFSDSNPLLMDGQLAVEMEDEIYQQIIAAANNGEAEVTVMVPLSNEPANWPHDGLIGDPIAQLFWKYRLIDHEIKVVVEPSTEINLKYHLPIW